MHHRTIVGFLCIATAGCALGGGAGSAPQRAGPAAYDIAYHLDARDTLGHRYNVQMDIGRLRGDTLELQLPVWSPGRYARMDFSRNVRGFKATTDDGKPAKA